MSSGIETVTATYIKSLRYSLIDFNLNRFRFISVENSEFLYIFKTLKRLSEFFRGQSPSHTSSSVYCIVVMDLLDLLGGREVEESKEASMFTCPMELMSEVFQIFISI